MSGGSPIATATQPHSPSTGQVYGGIPVGNVYASGPTGAAPAMSFQGLPSPFQLGQGLPHNRGNFSDDIGPSTTNLQQALFDPGPGYSPQQQTPLGIAGLQNNLPSSVGMPSGALGGINGMGGMGGTDVIVHGMPVGSQQSPAGLQQLLRGSQQNLNSNSYMSPYFDNTMNK